MWGSPWAGSEELWAKTAQRALQTGFRVSICLSFRPHPKHKKLEDLESAGADVFCFADSRLYVRARQFSQVARVLHRPLGEYLRERLSPLPAFFSTRPDVLLISDGGCIPSPAVMEAVWKHHLPRPYLILNQGNWGEIHGQIPSTVHRKKAAAFYQDARFALFVSESNLRATERQLTQRLVNARVVRNPVNLDCIDPVPWPQEGSICFASVARLEASTKGQDILFEVLSDDQWRHRDWHLCLYGSGDDELYLKGLSTFYGLDDQLTFCGQSEDIRKVWRAHHALMLPSRVEGTPLAMVEAMLCARPVIGTTVAGIPEWVCDGRNGFLADAPTVNCFARTLETAWQHRADWQAMGISGREDALKLYDPAPADTLLSIVMSTVRTHQNSCNVTLPQELVL